MMEIHRKKLDSGLRLVVVPAPSMRSITSFVVVANGSRYEKPEENGISHFLEHMLFKGTKNRPSEEEVFYDLDQTGGQYNGLTDKEWTGYYVRVRPEHFEFSLEWLADILTHPLLRKEEIEREKGVILEERNMYLDTPMRFIWDLWEKLLYGGTSLGQLIIGSEKNIKGFERKDFVDYFNARYGVTNLMVVVVGDVDPLRVFSQVERYFRALSSGRDEEPDELVEDQKAPQISLEEKETDQNHICLGFRGYDLYDSRRYAQVVLANILGGMRSSRLFMAIRGKRGMAYYLTTNSQSYTDTGYVVTAAGVNKGKTREAIRVVLAEYRRIRDHKVEPEEMKRAKENIKGGVALELESSNSLARFSARAELFDLKQKTPEQVFQAIDSVSAEEVQRMAKDIFKPQSLNLAIIGEEAPPDLKKIINEF